MSTLQKLEAERDTQFLETGNYTFFKHVSREEFINLVKNLREEKMFYSIRHEDGDSEAKIRHTVLRVSDLTFYTE